MTGTINLPSCNDCILKTPKLVRLHLKTLTHVLNNVTLASGAKHLDCKHLEYTKLASNKCKTIYLILLHPCLWSTFDDWDGFASVQVIGSNGVA